VVIENIRKATISNKLKNIELSGDPVAGTVEAKRFVNANSQAYGTARTAGKGNAVKAQNVTIPIDTDKEIVEELEDKDVRLYSVDDVLQRRMNNQVITVSTELDKAFFKVAADEAVKVELDNTAAVEDVLESIIQECENTSNNFVDGVPRQMMNLVLNTAWYGKVRNNLDKQTRSNVDTTAEEFYTWHGVATDSCIHLPTDVPFILMVRGAVAQPIMATQYGAEKIPLSNAYGVTLFYSYGTKVVTPDLIFVPDFAS
jgi:hypothetical protein